MGTTTVATEEILVTPEAGPLESFALSKILNNAHAAVLRKLNDLVESAQASVDTNTITGLPEYSLIERAAVITPPSIAGCRYVPELKPLCGYSSSLTAFRDSCLRIRR